MASLVYDPKTKEVFAKGPQYEPFPGGLGVSNFKRIQELIQESAAQSELIAQIEVETGKTQNFQELFNDSVKLAQFLQKSGIKPGDVISMCSYNQIHAAVVIVAVQFVGGVIACTDPILSFEDTKYLLDLVQPKMMFVSTGSETLIEKALHELQHINCELITFPDKFKNYKTIQDIMENNISECAFEPYYVDDLNATCAILFSSGTTGLPKGIELSHHYFLSVMTIYPKMTLKWVLLNYASFYWISCVYNLMASINLGSTRILCRKFSKEQHWNIVHKYKVTYLLLSNTYCMESAKYLDGSLTFPDLEVLIVAGGAIPDKEMSLCTEKLPTTLVGYIYALTEGAIVSTFQPGDKFGSVGKPFALNQTIKIVDPESNEPLALNSIGEIRIKRAHQMTGYHKMASADAWDSEGFLQTGDLGYLDDDFNLYVVDRIKEMFKYRSWHVVPAKIESVLGEHPAILYAIVIGKKTYNEDENHALAIVCLHEGKTATEADIESFANGKLDDLNKIRAGVKIVDKSLITFTPTGKIVRKVLKEMFNK